MYLQHFGLNEWPFSITPDTHFFFPSLTSREALNTMLIAARTGEGFIKVVGEVGTGKSLLCRKLIGLLADDFEIAYLPNPHLNVDTLLRQTAQELGVDVPSQWSQHEVLQALTERVMSIHNQGRRVLLCLDEAQAMPIETLEALRLFTNLETEKRKLLQVMIFGQPELEEKLDHPSIRQLRQRIVFHYDLSPLVHDEVDYYVQHRLTIAGHAGGRLFTRGALWLLTRRSKGIPRVVNILAHKALLSAYGRGRKYVSFADVRAADLDWGRRFLNSGKRHWGLLDYLLILLVLAGVALIVTGLVNWA